MVQGRNSCHSNTLICKIGRVNIYFSILSRFVLCGCGRLRLHRVDDTQWLLYLVYRKQYSAVIEENRLLHLLQAIRKYLHNLQFSSFLFCTFVMTLKINELLCVAGIPFISSCHFLVFSFSILFFFSHLPSSHTTLYIYYLFKRTELSARLAKHRGSVHNLQLDIMDGIVQVGKI